MWINLDLNSKRHDIVGPDAYSYPKQLDAMIHIYTTSQKFLNSKIDFFFKEFSSLTKPAFILSKIQ